MQLHHSRHHATYVNNLNVAEEKLAEAVAKHDVSTAIGLQGAIKFNGGGHLNHSIFWQNLCPGGSGEPTGALADAINRDFGSFENMKTKLSASTVAVQVKFVQMNYCPSLKSSFTGIRMGMVGI